MYEVMIVERTTAMETYGDSEESALNAQVPHERRGLEKRFWYNS